MGGRIGSIVLDDPLYWVTEKTTMTLGTEKRALDGSVVQSYLTAVFSVSTKHTFRFTWISYANLQSIKELIKGKSSFMINVTDTSASIGPCRFASDEPLAYKPVVDEEFFSPEEVKEGPLDLYNGEIHVWIDELPAT
jgi:hypothetical protein